jgi:hypothetical protein
MLSNVINGIESHLSLQYLVGTGGRTLRRATRRVQDAEKSRCERQGARRR